MISSVVLTKNEEKNIRDCLSSVSWCDEVLVIDDFSEDKTIEIAQKLGARVIRHHLNNDFSKQRNFALKEAKGDWVLFLDADERITPQLAKEIQQEIKSSEYTGFYFRRIDYFINGWLKHGEVGGLGEKLGFLGGVKILRLAKKNAGLWTRKVDETWQIKGKTKILKNPLLHYSHLSLKDFLTSINTRSSLNAEQFYKENPNFNDFDWLKPILKFLKNYFLLLGFLDKSRGFVFATLMSFHSFLVRGKLYLMFKKNSKLKNKKNRFLRNIFILWLIFVFISYVYFLIIRGKQRWSNWL